MNERLALAFALVLVGALGLFFLRRQSPTSLPVLAIVISITCGVFYPVATIWINPRSWRNISNLSEESILGTQIDYLAFGLGILTAILLGGALWRRLLAEPRPAPAAPHRVVFRDTFMAWGLLIFGGILYANYVRNVGLVTLVSTEDFADKYLASRGLGVYLIGLNVMMVGCLWAEASQVSKRTRWLMRVVGAGIIAWATLFIAVRTYAAAMIIGYTVIYARDHRIQLRQIRLRLVLLILCAYVGMEAYAILRSSWKLTGDLGAAIELARSTDADDAFGAVVGGSELSHPFLTMVEIMEYEEAGELRGRSYLDAVLAFVPLFLWDERPQTLAQIYVAKYYPAVDERGGGSAFTFVGEAWWNFGHIFGPWFTGTLLGLFLLFCHHRSQRYPHGLVNRIVPYTTFLVLLFHRSQVSASFKQVMSIVLPCLVFAVLAELVWQVLLAPRLPAPGRASSRPSPALPRPLEAAPLSSGPRPL